MTLTYRLIALAALLAVQTAGAAENSVESYTTEAKGLVSKFATQLQGELKTALQEGGPVRAIDVCKTRAPEIASDLAEESGWEVGRTSLRVRNADTNAPDAWELKTLDAFEARKSAGESPDSLVTAEVVTTDEGQTFRFMKPIPTQDLCLVCHGKTIEPEVASALDRRYPKDQARGFSTGDLRGAFSLSRPIAELD